MKDWIALIQQMPVLSIADLQIWPEELLPWNMWSSKKNTIRYTLNNSAFNNIDFIMWLIFIYTSERQNVIYDGVLQIKTL